MFHFLLWRHTRAQYFLPLRKKLTPDSFVVTSYGCHLSSKPAAVRHAVNPVLQPATVLLLEYERRIIISHKLLSVVSTQLLYRCKTWLQLRICCKKCEFTACFYCPHAARHRPSAFSSLTSWTASSGDVTRRHGTLEMNARLPPPFDADVAEYANCRVSFVWTSVTTCTCTWLYMCVHVVNIIVTSLQLLGHSVCCSVLLLQWPCWTDEH